MSNENLLSAILSLSSTGSLVVMNEPKQIAKHGMALAWSVHPGTNEVVRGNGQAMISEAVLKALIFLASVHQARVDMLYIAAESPDKNGD